MENCRSVIIVDDEETIREMLGEWLTREGYRCETAGTAQAALALLQHSSFDFMLTDIVMPGMNGLDLTKRVKQLKPNMPVIVMTGFSEDFSYDNVLEAGASDFVKKPFTLQELMARIRILHMQKDVLTWAITDELTGIYNRKGFFTLASHLLKMARRTGKSLILLYADLDNLKAINDEYGHKEGDLALVETAEILRRNYRESDIVARIGGDEFVVFPVESLGDSLEMITVRLENILEQRNAEMKARYRLSLSWGTSLFDPESNCTIDELLIRADESMYEMKRRKKEN